MQGADTSYQQLLDILQGKELSNTIFGSVEKRTFGSTLIIDGQSIVATMEILGKAYHVPAALHLLRLAVDGARHNHLYRNEQHLPRHENLDIPHRDDNGDKNELRQVYRSTISLLGHSHNRQNGTNHSSRLIMHLLHHHMPKIAQIQPGTEIYHAAINALGKIGECDVILELLDEMENSCGTSIDNNDAKIAPTTNNAPSVDKMAYQTAISSLSRNYYCNDAMQLYRRMQSKGLTPDINTYNQLLIGIAKEAGRMAADPSLKTTDAGTNTSIVDENSNGLLMPWHKVALHILHEMENNQLRPTDQIYDSIISACTSEGECNMAARITEKAELQRHHGTKRKFGSIENDSLKEDNIVSIGMVSEGISANNIQNAAVAYFDNLKAFRKCGKSSEPWWEICRYTVSNAGDHISSDDQPNGLLRSIIVGIQPHKNPFRNGLSLVFFDEASRVKLGRMLLRNTSIRPSLRTPTLLQPLHFSSLVGMEVNKERRGLGLSKVFVALWLRMCLNTNTYPRAAVMNKPLISRVLMGFNFVPQNGGSRVELIRLNNSSNNVKCDLGIDYNPQFALYSPSAKSLKGLFSQRALRLQNIAILNHPPSPNLRQNVSIIYVKSEFEHPIAILENAVHYNPPSSLSDDNIPFVAVLEEQRHRSATGQCEIQRDKLSTQINEILKTNADGSSGLGNLEFFSNSVSLKVAFLSDNMFLYSTDALIENSESREEDLHVSKRLKRSCESAS